MQRRIAPLCWIVTVDAGLHDRLRRAAAALDVLARLALLNFLKEEADAGCSIIYCTHILDGLDGI